MAKAALEMAVLDAELRIGGPLLASYLGAVHLRVPSGVSVGIMPLDRMNYSTPWPPTSSRDTGGSSSRSSPDGTSEPVRAVRERFGDELALQVDANTAYTLADARHLAGLDPFDLLLIEQPLPEDDLAGHAALARRLRTPICLDESITSARAAADAIVRGACSVVNIKAGRVGGYLEARRVHDVCAAHGVPVWCGGMLETGLGRAANAGAGGPPELHPARGHLGVGPLLAGGHHRAFPARGRPSGGADRARLGCRAEPRCPGGGRPLRRSGSPGGPARGGVHRPARVAARRLGDWQARLL